MKKKSFWEFWKDFKEIHICKNCKRNSWKDSWKNRGKIFWEFPKQNSWKFVEKIIYLRRIFWRNLQTIFWRNSHINSRRKSWRNLFKISDGITEEILDFQMIFDEISPIISEFLWTLKSFVLVLLYFCTCTFVKVLKKF